MKKLISCVSLFLACLFTIGLCVSCSKKIDYTVTKEEYMENWNATNVIMDMKSSGGERWTLYFTENAQADRENDEEIVFNNLKIGDQWYGLSESDGVWYALAYDYFDPTMYAHACGCQTHEEGKRELLEKMGLLYDYATYSSKEHCYIVDGNEAGFKGENIRLYFENKKLVCMKFESQDNPEEWQAVYFSNYGTTTIDAPIPEYTIK